MNGNKSLTLYSLPPRRGHFQVQEQRVHSKDFKCFDTENDKLRCSRGLRCSLTVHCSRDCYCHSTVHSLLSRDARRGTAEPDNNAFNKSNPNRLDRIHLRVVLIDSMLLNFILLIMLFKKISNVRNCYRIDIEIFVQNCVICHVGK